MPRIGIIAGEISGDILGAGLIRAIKKRIPDTKFEGIAGPRMKEEGCVSLYPIEQLSVMGLVEVLGKYWTLRSMRSSLIRRFLDDPPDIFIGIDAPDFNLGIEEKLKKAGIPTVHYVSPSVWAWRQYRLKKIARSVDLMLTLFPFEAEYYRKHQIPVQFVGHPLADMIPLKVEIVQARKDLGITGANKVVAILPGSRVSEASRLADDFVKAAWHCHKRKPELLFVAPMVNQKIRAIFEEALAKHAPKLPIMIFDGQARETMAVADVVLLACGTAALEAMLLKKPMVVAYRVSPLTYLLAKQLVKIDQYSLPNLLAGQALVPEFIQSRVTADNLGRAVLTYLTDPTWVSALQTKFTEIHAQLQQNASETAAEAIFSIPRL